MSAEVITAGSVRAPHAQSTATRGKAAPRLARADGHRAPAGRAPRAVPADTPREVEADAPGAAKREALGTASAQPRRPRAATRDDTGRSDVLIYMLMAVLIAAAWQISRLQWIKANDNISYWIAVTGGSMMLILFSYPLRKYVRFMQGLGKVKWWFWFHLSLGIAGPWLILVHSTFRVGSLNAGVALYSMCIVVASGVVGRFIYVRVHRGLDGQRMSLDELRKRARLVETDARSRLHFAPKVEAALLAFEERELHAEPNWPTHLRQVTLLPVMQRITYLRCMLEVRRTLRSLASEQEWRDSDLVRRDKKSRKLVWRYLDAVVRVAQYTAYERVFSLWHLAHLPFIYLLVISAVVHVIAVHAY
ncbi:MAG: hypothetical protein OEV65_12895 [Aquincola sp.]|nr:hypothetical protein [Aquincola sp.]